AARPRAARAQQPGVAEGRTHRPPEPDRGRPVHAPRRQFLQTIAILPAAAALPRPLLRGMLAPLGGGPRNLVLVDLEGGNDGLNMVVPFGVNGGLYYKREPATPGIPAHSL